VGDRIEVRFSGGIPRHGIIKRVFRSGNLTVFLDRPMSRGRQTHVEPHQVNVRLIAATQAALF
jgi:hypothetical protein